MPLLLVMLCGVGAFCGVMALVALGILIGAARLGRDKERDNAPEVTRHS